MTEQLYQVRNAEDDKLLLIASAAVVRTIFSLHKDAMLRMHREIASSGTCTFYFPPERSHFLSNKIVVSKFEGTVI